MRRHFIPILVISIFVFLLFKDFFLFHKVLYYRDITIFYYPIFEGAKTNILKGNIPIWNSNVVFGTPIYAQPDGIRIFYPFFLFFIIMNCAKALTFIVILHLIIIGYSTYALLNYLKLNKIAALFGAIAFTGSGYVISIANGQYGLLIGFTWLPLFWLYLEKAIKAKKWKYIVLASICISLITLTTSFECLYMIIFISIILIIAKAFMEKRIMYNLGANFFILFLSVIVGIGIAAIQFIPSCELFLLSMRTQKIGLERATIWSLPPWQLITLIIPEFFGNSIKGTIWGESFIGDKVFGLNPYIESIYLGIAPLCLVAFLKVRKQLIPFLIISIFSLFLSLGRYTPLYGIIYKVIPFFSSFRYPIKYFIFTTLTVSILGAFSLSNIDLDKQKKSKTFIYFISVLSTIFVVLLFIFRDKFSQIFYNIFYDNTYLPEGFNRFNNFLNHLIISVVFIDIFAFIIMLRKTNFILPLLIIDLFISASEIISLSQPFYKNPSSLILSLEKLIPKDVCPPRIYGHHWKAPKEICVDGLLKAKLMHEVLVQSGGLPYDKNIVNQSQINLFSEFEQAYLEDMTNSKIGDKFMDLANVEYYLSSSPIYKNNYTLLDTVKYESPLIKETLIYKRENVLPRAYLYKIAYVINTSKVYYFPMWEDFFDISKMVILNEKELKKKKQLSILKKYVRTKDIKKRRERCEIIEYKSTRVTVETEAPGPRILMLSDLNYPGWKAYIDNKEYPILSAFHIFRAILVPEGKHTIVFKFFPKSLLVGLIISISSLFIIFYIQTKKKVDKIFF